MDFAPAPCSLVVLLDQCLSMAQGVSKSKDIVIHLDIPKDMTVLVDQPMVNAMVRNILFNAIKFTPRGGTIVIKAQQRNQEITVSIKDNGIGMSEQVRSSVFTMEASKRQRGTEGEQGTGLGLVLCKQFIELHGGRIWLDSAPGEGTTVYFTLKGAEDVHC